MTFAEKTSVPVERSEAEIKGLLRKYGADQFMSGEGNGRVMLAFRAKGRHVRFLLNMPAMDEHRFTHVKHANRYFEQKRTEKQAADAYEQEVRRLWRALVLTLKAKLEAVESNIETFEEAFLSHIIMPDGKTVGDHVLPTVAEAYETNRMPSSLLALPPAPEVSR